MLGGGEGVTQDWSSWLEIRQAAWEVGEICKVGDRTGGKITTGERGRIWIKLSKVSFGGTVIDEVGGGDVS